MSSLVFNSCSFHSAYAPWDGQLPDHALGCIQFGLGLARTSDPRHVVTALDNLDAAPLAEWWLSDRPVQRGWADGFGYAHNGEVMFASMFLPESELADLERATLKAYVHIEQVQRRMGYPHYLRMWNFLSGINAGDGDHERYRLFSAGRNRALALKPDFEKSLPAATAIGMLEPGLVIYFLAGRTPGQQVENPRQVSAFHYPRQYGVKSPSFSRATLIGAGPTARLLVSGTASVVGHETLHPGDAVKQLEETVANIESLIANTLSTHFPGATRAAALPQSLKVFVRDPAHLPALEPQLARLRGPQGAPILHLHGDICRADLLLEIEAIYTIAAAL